MAELADAPDLGSGVPDVKVQVLSGAPYTERIFFGKSVNLIQPVEVGSL